MSEETEIRAALAVVDGAKGMIASINAEQALGSHFNVKNIRALLAELDARQAETDVLHTNAECAGQLVLAVRSWDSVDSSSDDASYQIEKLSQALGDYDEAMAQSKQGGA